jgi:predicted CopG family antitoxin
LKTLNITLEDHEYEQLSKVKGSRTWKELLLSLIGPKPVVLSDCAKEATPVISVEKKSAV